MMNSYRLIGLCFVFAALILAGCKENQIAAPGQSNPRSAELQALQTQVEQSDSIADFLSSDAQILDDMDLRSDESGSTGNTVSSITPVRWGRHIFWKQITRSTETQLIGDSIAIVTTTRTVPAELRIGVRFAGDSVGVDSVIKKPFVLDVKRTVRFIRIGWYSTPDSNWRPVAISLVFGKTVPADANTFAVTSVQVSSSMIDTVITNPLDMFFRYGHGRKSEIPRFAAGDNVRIRVTVQSQNDSAEVVLLRHGFAGALAERHRVKMQLISTAGMAGSYTRVYERSFQTSPLPHFIPSARLNATVDVLSYGSLHDGQTSVANEFWGIPYIVTNH